MRVSVIVPAFNGEKTLPGLLQALTAQTYPAELTEILCVDNNSTDRTGQIIKQWSERRVRYLSCSRQGSYAARNVGIVEAQGDILAFTDADCRPTPDWLRAGIQQMTRENLDRLAGAVHMPITEPVSVWALLDASWYLDQETYVEQGWAPTANLLIRRTVVDQIGLFDDTLISGGDAEFGLRCTTYGIPIGYSPQAVVIHPPRTQAMQIIRRSWRIGLGHAQITSSQLSVGARRPWRKQRRLFEERLGHLSLSLGRRIQLQLLKYGSIALVRKVSYLWGCWVLQRQGAEEALLGAIHRENGFNP